MSSPPVVSNSSPLIALDGIGELNLLEKLFTDIVIPPAVTRETASSKGLPGWIREMALGQAIGAQVLSASLGAGESEAICLALELNARWVLLDDRPARRLAQSLNLPVIGTLGVLLTCKRRGLIQAIKPLVDGLVRFGFRVSPSLYQRVIKAAGEGP